MFIKRWGRFKIGRGVIKLKGDGDKGISGYGFWFYYFWKVEIRRSM